MTGKAALALPRSTPEEHGVRSSDVLAFLNELHAAGLNPHGVMLARQGRVIAEAFWRPCAAEHRRQVYSVTKSFTATAVGFAIAEGYLKLDDGVIAFFPDDLPAKVSANLAAMRVRDLLTMTTGHAIDSTMAILLPRLVHSRSGWRFRLLAFSQRWNLPSNTPPFAEPENWARAVLGVRVAHAPGTHFVYNSGATYLLSAIVQKVTGQTTKEYLGPRLFEPLGFGDVTWDECPRGVSIGGWGLRLSLEELTKFGILYAQDGIWNGHQVLPAGWARAAGARQVPNVEAAGPAEVVDWRQGYGYQFWRCRHNAFRADGAAGQFCVVMPDQDAVLTIFSETQNMQGVLDLVWSQLLPAFGSTQPMEVNKAGQATMLNATSALETSAPIPIKPQLAEQISGKHFTISRNKDQVRAVSFTFQTGESVFRLWDSSGEHVVRAEAGCWTENDVLFPFMLPSMPNLLLNEKLNQSMKVAAQVTWRDETTVTLTLRYLESAHADTISCRFKGKRVFIEVCSSLAEPGNPFVANTRTKYIGTLR